MSIYATLWELKFPKDGDAHTGCAWVSVLAQGVPAHIGTPTPGPGNEVGDPYGAFLPPPVDVDEEGDADFMRAVVFVVKGTPKGTARSGQEYIYPLLVVSGKEYANSSFQDLHGRICDALRGGLPRVVMEVHGQGQKAKIVHEDGTVREVEGEQDSQ